MTDEYQRSLPRLPVPTLEDTIARYLDSVRALVNARSSERWEKLARKTEQLAREFVLRRDGAGVRSQEYLEARAAQLSHTSWFLDYWMDAYLCDREPMAIRVNPMLNFNDDPQRRVGVCRAASLVIEAARFRGLIVRRELKPEKLLGNPVCMRLFDYALHTLREPRTGRDEILAPTAEQLRAASDPRMHDFVVVLRHNRFFRVEFAHENDRSLLSEVELAARFAAVVRLSNEIDAERGAAPPLGALTGDDRDAWASNFESLRTHSRTNADTLAQFERAMLFVCLEDGTPSSRQDKIDSVFHNNAKNRWFDKCAQMVVWEDGQAGCCTEHTAIDGLTMRRLYNFVLRNSLQSRASPPPSERDIESSLNHVAHLPLDLPSDRASALVRAQERFSTLARENLLSAFEFDEFGKSTIKRGGVSPDAFVQMMFQLAFHRLTGEFVAVYETAVTTKFLHGRTECIRALTADSCEFVKAMNDPRCSTAARARALVRATTTHKQQSIKALNGQGIDRHLSGLKRAAKELGLPTPELFTDPLFAESSRWRISTSQMTCAYMETGFGPVDDNGVGVCYGIYDTRLHFHVCVRRSCDFGIPQFVSSLFSALREGRALIEHLEATREGSARL